MNDDAQLIHPRIVPMRLLIVIGRAGLETTEQIHAHIKAGTLSTLPGIGRAYENKIIAWYIKDGLKPTPLTRTPFRGTLDNDGRT